MNEFVLWMNDKDILFVNQGKAKIELKVKFSFCFFHKYSGF